MAIRMKYISGDPHFNKLATDSFEFYRRASTNNTYVHSNGFFGYEHDYNNKDEIKATSESPFDERFIGIGSPI